LKLLEQLHFSSLQQPTRQGLGNTSNKVLHSLPYSVLVCRYGECFGKHYGNY
jgi:hypothetical protein